MSLAQLMICLLPPLQDVLERGQGISALPQFLSSSTRSQPIPRSESYLIMDEKHILVADANTETFEEFRQMLGPKWKVTGVETGAATLSALKDQPYDVLVVSLHLADMETSQLLNRVRSKFPKTVRFVVAADQDRQRVVKEVLGAHQFLTRPFDAEGLRSSIERAMAFELWIDSSRLRELVARMRTLPTVPALYHELLAALRSSNTTTEEIGELIAKDMSIMTKLLQVINSAYFGLPRTITSAEEAVGLLGFETIKSMVMAVKLLNQYDRIKPSDFSIDGLWQHSTAVAQNARRLVLLETGDRAKAEEAFAAGLLHDVGKVVLAGNFGEQYRGAQSLAAKRQIPLWQVEKEIFGASHGEVGAYLLGLWGMPLEILEAAALHPEPSRSVNKCFSALTAVHVANVLEHEVAARAEGRPAPPVDTAYLKEIGMLERLPAWREEILGPEANDMQVEPEEPTEPQTSSCVPEATLTAAPPPALSIDSQTSVDAEPVELQTSETSGLLEFKSGCPAPSCASDSAVETACSWEAESKSPAAPNTARRKPLLFAAVAVGFTLLVIWLIVERQSRQGQQSIDVKAQQVRPAPTAGAREATPTPNQDAREVEPKATDPSSQASVEPVATPATAESSNSISALPLSQSTTNSLELSAIPEAPGFPSLKLQGIIFSHDHPSAIISGVLVHPNERLLGVRIVEIRSGSVTLEYKNQRKLLSLE